MDASDPIRRFSYANVMATLAVFVALGGAAYAAVVLPRNSVKAKQIAANAVKRPEVAAGAVAGPEVVNGSLVAEDFAPGELPAGEQGPPGPTFAEVRDSDDPPVSPDGTLATPPATSVTTPVSGRLLVMFSSQSIQINCTSGISGLGLYVDGAPVPDTLREFASSTGAVPVDVFGVTAGEVAAGTHMLTVGRDCPTGDLAGQANAQNNSLGVILLGG